MKILAVGGGSGGHVTPVVAVLREIRHRNKDAEIRFWCDRKFAPQAKSIVHHFDKNIPVKTIFSGKFRRYHNLSLLQQVFLRPFDILFPNIRDMIFAGIGFVQSFFALLFWRPDVVFTKGGFVCLPVGLATKLLRIPLVIHDSDAHPGLTNRVLAKWADAIATGAPLKHYPYPKQISRYVGIPIAKEFAPLGLEQQQLAKRELELNPNKPLVVVTGGGLGARRINDAVAKILPNLLEHASVVLISGNAQYDELRATTPEADERFQLHAFVSQGMARLLGAADVVVARAGATTILELAALATPTILIPNGYLTGGHQLKNAEAYAESGAVAVVDEHAVDADAGVLFEAIVGLLQNDEARLHMAEVFHGYAKPHAAEDMADMILDAVK